MGLAAKNAILIVEFAKAARERGSSAIQAAKSAALLRLRPILMTSFAFILGVMPLVFASGAGSAARIALGTSVVSGMLFATIVGIVMVPVFFVVVQRISERRHPFRATTAERAELENDENAKNMASATNNDGTENRP